MQQKIEEAEVLQEFYITPKSDWDGEYSKTAQFMIPATGVKVTNKLIFKFFVNAFLTDMEHTHNYVRPIFFLFSIKNFKDPEWLKVYNTLIKSKNYITEYDVGVQKDKFLLMMVFQVPKEFEQDYINFKLGRYSQFSEEYKKKFPEYVEETKKKNIHWQIINKDDDLKREIEKEYLMEPGDLDKTFIHKYTKESVPPAKEIWEKPRKERENYRYKEKMQS